MSALTARALGWRTPPNLEMRIADVEWPLLLWVRSMVAAHLVRVFAGALFCGSPAWTAYLRLAGARLGRRVYVNCGPAPIHPAASCRETVDFFDRPAARADA